ncbi:MAG: hypothetical protein AAF840_09165 [Bacteroidota bacterium]
MKHLLAFLFAFLFAWGANLSAQTFRVRAELGAAGVLDISQSVGHSAEIGLETLIPLSPRTFLVPEAGIQFRSYTLNRVDNFPLDIIGQIPVNFIANEEYQINRSAAMVGLGIEQHLDRLRIQVGTRVAHRLSDRITFSETEVFNPINSRLDNVFSVTVDPAEQFTQGMQTGTISFNNQIILSSGLSIRYDLTGNFELGFSVWRTIGNNRLERRVISFCEGCPVDENNPPEVDLPAGTTVLQLSSRFTF